MRPKLVFGNDTLVVCTLEDLVEVLCMTQNLKGIPPHKIEFFKKIFISTYLAKREPDINENNGKQEKIKAVTTRQLCDKLKELDGKIMQTDSLKDTYLEELLNKAVAAIIYINQLNLLSPWKILLNLKVLMILLKGF
jgi:hypothetical protein